MTSFVVLLTKGNNHLPIHKRPDSLMKETNCEKMLKSKPHPGLALKFNGY